MSLEKQTRNTAWHFPAPESLRVTLEALPKTGMEVQVVCLRSKEVGVGQGECEGRESWRRSTPEVRAGGGGTGLHQDLGGCRACPAGSSLQRQ